MMSKLASKPHLRPSKNPKSEKFAFLLSVLLHFSLLLLIGGAVIIPAVVQKSVFISDPSMMVQQEASIEAPPDASTKSDELPFSATPQETVPLSEPQAPSTPLETVVMRNDTTAINTWNSLNVSSAPPVNIKIPITQKTSEPDKASEAPVDKEHQIISSSKITLFGSPEPSEGGLKGTFYDLKRLRSGSRNPIDAVTREGYSSIIHRFTKANWDESILQKYWKGPANLYIKQIMINNMPSDGAPSAFGIKAEPSGWIIHYTGNVVASKTEEFRFVGRGDNVLLVRFNNQTVLDASLGVGTPDSGGVYYEKLYSDWPADLRSITIYTGNGKVHPFHTPSKNWTFNTGDWITVEKGKVYPIEVIIGERPGNGFFAFLFTQSKANADGPVDIFSTEPNLPLTLKNIPLRSTGKAAYFQSVQPHP